LGNNHNTNQYWSLASSDFRILLIMISQLLHEQDAGRRDLFLKIAQPFMAGFTVREFLQSRQGRKKCSAVPDGT
jgi:hypothetical protein